MPTLSLSAVAAPNEVASAIELGGELTLTLTHGNADLHCHVAGGRDYCELRLVDADGKWMGGSVTVERPNLRYGGDQIPANVTWSSSGSREGLDAARVTSRLLQFAIEVADQLDRFAAQPDSRIALATEAYGAERAEADARRAALDARIAQVRAQLQEYAGWDVKLATEPRNRSWTGQLTIDADGPFVLVGTAQIRVSTITDLAVRPPLASKFAPYRPVELVA